MKVIFVLVICCLFSSSSFAAGSRIFNAGAICAGALAFMTSAFSQEPPRQNNPAPIEARASSKRTLDSVALDAINRLGKEIMKNYREPIAAAERPLKDGRKMKIAVKPWSECKWGDEPVWDRLYGYDRFKLQVQATAFQIENPDGTTIQGSITVDLKSGGNATHVKIIDVENRTLATYHGPAANLMVVDSATVDVFKTFNLQIIKNFKRYQQGQLDDEAYAPEVRELFGWAINDARMHLHDFKRALQALRDCEKIEDHQSEAYRTAYSEAYNDLDHHPASFGVQLLFGMGGWGFIHQNLARTGNRVSYKLKDGRTLKINTYPLAARYYPYQIVELKIVNPDQTSFYQTLNLNLLTGEIENGVHVLDAKGTVLSNWAFPSALE